jgi:hypothetical protein
MDDITFLIAGLLSGIEAMHAKEIVHADIK